MTSSNQDLLQLFAELKAAGSPVRRMKILGRAWRTLRRLSPKARRDLAAQVGVDGAEDVLEQLAGKNRRLSPAALLAALEALRGADPNDLRQTLSDLKQPEGRRKLLDQGIDAVARTLEPAESAPLSEPPLTALDAVPLQPGEQPPQPPMASTPAATTPATAAAAAAVAAGAAAAAARRPRTTPAQRQAVARERQRATRPTTRAASSPAATAASALRAKAPPARPARSSTPSPAPLPAPRAVESSPPRREAGAGGDLVAALSDTERLNRKFRILRERVDESRGMPVEELRRVLDAFPSEWARRRALSWLLDRRIPRDLDQAIYLVEGLESQASQRWCVARILHAWPLAEQERSALLERRGAFIRRVS